MRTFLILVTLICPALGIVGAIKFKASSYRSAMAKLQASGIDVRRIRTEVGASQWESFVQDWIDNDAYAGDSVEVTMSRNDLRPSELRLLQTLKEIRSIDLASPALTDATLVELTKLGPFRSLTIRDGTYTSAGLANISQFTKLRSLDLSGVPIDAAKLLAVEPSLGVRDLALNLNDCTPRQLEVALQGRTYEHLYLENAALKTLLNQGSPYGRSDPAQLAAMSLDASILPPCEYITLKRMQLSEETLKQLGQRKGLKTISLLQCDFDATVALRSFQTLRRGSGKAPSVGGVPVISISGEIVANSEMTTKDLALLLDNPAITSVTIHKLKSPNEAVAILKKMINVTVFNLPGDIPDEDLITLLRSRTSHLSINIYRSDVEIDQLMLEYPNAKREHYRFGSMSDHLQKHGIDLPAMQREWDRKPLKQKSP